MDYLSLMNELESGKIEAVPLAEKELKIITELTRTEAARSSLEQDQLNDAIHSAFTILYSTGELNSVLEVQLSEWRQKVSDPSLRLILDWEDRNRFN